MSVLPLEAQKLEVQVGENRRFLHILVALQGRKSVVFYDVQPSEVESVVLVVEIDVHPR